MEITIKLNSDNQGDLVILALLNKHLRIQPPGVEEQSQQSTASMPPASPKSRVVPDPKPEPEPEPEPAPPPKPRAKAPSKPIEEMDFAELTEAVRANGADAVKAKFLAKRYVMDHNGDKEPLLKILQEIGAATLLDLRTKKDLTTFCDRTIALVEAENGPF